MKNLEAIILLIAASVFFIPAFVLPFTQPLGTLLGLDGSINVMDHSDIWDSIGAVSGFYYGLGDMICHQEQSRSFVLNDNQMYVCMRDISILGGFILGLVLTMVKDMSLSRISKAEKVILLLLFLSTLLEWAVEKLADVDLPVSRCVTAIVTGAVTAIVLIYLINRTNNKVSDE